MEDLILVTGCTLVTSWAAAVFVDNIEAEISLESWALSNGATSFVWRNIRGPVVYRNSCLDLVRSPTTFTLQALIYFVWKARSTYDSGSMRLHPGFPSKTHFKCYAGDPSLIYSKLWLSLERIGSAGSERSSGSR